MTTPRTTATGWMSEEDEMVAPVAGHGIDTPYGVRGPYWSCNKDSNGNGIHTGVDYPCASNTPLVAAIAGTIRHRNYGSAFGDRQFAISPSEGQPFADGEVFYAHGNERLADGTEVQVGDYVGQSGARGNATGPHLHFEYHPQSKNVWNCGCIANPDPVIQHGGGSGSDYPPPTSKVVHLSKLRFGQEDSDSVWYLQDALNDHPLTGGATIPTSGGYFTLTDAEVIKCQTQHGYGADAPGASFVGAGQAEHLFAGRGLSIVYDI
jgi:Peptidase family M23